MKIKGDSPIYKLKDERFFLALCRENMDSHNIDIYFINNSTEEIKSLRMRIVEYCYKPDIRESEQQSYAEEWFYSINPGEYKFLTAINIVDDRPGEFISSFQVITEKERVITECTMYKEKAFPPGFDKLMPVVEKAGKKVSLESRTFPI